MVAGNGTMAAEVPDVRHGVVAVGGGGLLGGCLAFWEDGVRVVAVETDGTPTLHAALAAGEPVDVDVSAVVRRQPRRPAARCRCRGSWCSAGPCSRCSCPDADVLDAQRRLWAACRLYAEPGGAAALAAVTSGAYVPGPDERVCVVVCGANGDPSTITPSR